MTALRVPGGSSCGQASHLHEIVGEDPVTGPGPRSFQGVHVGPAASPLSLDRTDTALGTRSPAHHLLEADRSLDPLARRSGPTLAWDRHEANPELVQLSVDGRLAVAAVSGDLVGDGSGAGMDALDRGKEHRCVGRVALLHLPVEDHAVLVVDDLRLVAEFHWTAEPALSNGAGVGIVQGHKTRGAFWDHAVDDALARLCGDLLDPSGKDLEIYRRVVVPDKRLVTIPLPVMSVIDRLFMGGRLAPNLQIMRLLARLGERGDPTPANELLGAPTMTVKTWCEAKAMSSGVTDA
jgi:hypothetical protein